jgi:ferredoxin-NADP reductase
MALPRAGRLVERLTTPLDVDAYLSTIRPLWGHGTARIESITPVGIDAASLRLRPGRGWDGHRPGQFVTLGVEVDGVRHHRSFSLTSVPGDATLEVTVQATPHGLVSRHPGPRCRRRRHGASCCPLPAGSRCSTAGRRAAGGRHGRKRGDPPRSVCSGGLDAAGVEVDAVVLHHSASPQRALFTDELDRLAGAHRGLRVEHIHSRADGSHRLDADRLTALCPDWTERHGIVCGPEPMLDAASAIWLDAGVEDRLHVERFHPATVDLRATHRTPPMPPSTWHCSRRATWSPGAVAARRSWLSPRRPGSPRPRAVAWASATPARPAWSAARSATCATGDATSQVSTCSSA